MMEQAREIEFAKKHGFYAGDIHAEEETYRFLKSMEDGLAGRSTSLAMVPTHINIADETMTLLKSDAPVLVIDIGGTNVRAAIMQNSVEDGLLVSDFRTRQIPGIDEPITTAAFFDSIAEFVLPLAERTERIGLCFSFESVPQPDRDAVIAGGGKQVNIIDSYGKKCGVELKTALTGRGCTVNHSVTVVNDSICALLSGYVQFHADDEYHFDNYIGMIFGTGFNVSYCEKDALINTEAGYYREFPFGDIDQKSFLETFDPDIDWAEKVISGRYFGAICSAILSAAAEEHLLSDYFQERFHVIKPIGTDEIGNFLSSAHDRKGSRLSTCCRDSRDMQTTKALLELAQDRSALFISISLTAAMLRAAKLREGSNNFCICAEGSTYYRLSGIREKISAQMEKLRRSLSAPHCRFMSVENAVMKGTYFAGLYA